MFNKNQNNVITFRDYTGEVNDFALTKVGIIRLVKHIVDLNLAFTPVNKNLIDNEFKKVAVRNGHRITRPTKEIYYDYFLHNYIDNYLLSYSNIDFNLRNEVDVYFNNLAKARNDDISANNIYWDWHIHFNIEQLITPINLVYAITPDGRKYLFENQVFDLNGTVLDITYKSFVRTCEICGEKFLSQNDMEDAGIKYSGIPQCLIGVDGYCRDCAYQNDYSTCADCGRLVDSDDMTYIDNTDEYVCNDCFRNGDYATCHSCGANIYTGDGDYVYSEEDGHYYCNGDCAEDDGLHWSDYEDDWVYEEEDRIMNGYHSTHFAKIGNMPKNSVQWLGNGGEIEVYGEDPNYKETFWQETIIHKYLQDGKYGSVEHDGSVTAEIVMQPMTEKELAKFDFEGMMDALRKEGYTGHDNNCCGSHQHYSNGYLGYTKDEIMNNAKKVCAFFESNWDDLVKISRRKPDQLSWCKRYGFEITKDTDFERLSCDRYHAVNLTNLFTEKRGTIEIRIPRGTLNAKTYRATVDFFRHIVRNAKTISWKNIDNLKLWFKGIKDKNTIDYIKSRDAFVGEF